MSSAFRFRVFGRRRFRSTRNQEVQLPEHLCSIMEKKHGLFRVSPDRIMLPEGVIFTLDRYRHTGNYAYVKLNFTKRDNKHHPIAGCIIQAALDDMEAFQPEVELVQ